MTEPTVQPEFPPLAPPIAAAPTPKSKYTIPIIIVMALAVIVLFVNNFLPNLINTGYDGTSNATLGLVSSAVVFLVLLGCFIGALILRSKVKKEGSKRGLATAAVVVSAIVFAFMVIQIAVLALILGVFALVFGG
ncbi:MAG: hypothetical protein ABJB03_02660 [Rhodoglobus sp.]